MRSGAQVEYVQDLNTLGSNRVITDSLAGFGDRGFTQAVKGIPSTFNPMIPFKKEAFDKSVESGQKLSEYFDGIGRFAAVFEELRRGTPLKKQYERPIASTFGMMT